MRIVEVMMFKPSLEYKIETCPSSDKEALEQLLNKMSDEGWELYSMSETEIDGEYCYNCIFQREIIEVADLEDDGASILDLKPTIEAPSSSRSATSIISL